MGIALLIGFVNDKTKPTKYYYKNSIVTVYKKYQCPKYCDVQHHHYVYYDNTSIHKSGMVINKSMMGKKYKPPKEKKNK